MSRCLRPPSRAWASSPSWSRRRSRTSRPGPTSPRPAHGSSRPRTTRRRRLVRDLHDGAQQRLVHTVVTLKLAALASEAGAGRHGRARGRGPRPRAGRHRRAPRARARHPAGGPHPRRTARRRRGADVADAGADRLRRLASTGSRTRSRRPRTSSSPSRSPTSPSTHAPSRATVRAHVHDGTLRDPGSATTASAAPGPTKAASWGSRTGSPSSAAGSASRARPTAGRSSPRRSRSATRRWCGPPVGEDRAVD